LGAVIIGCVVYGNDDEISASPRNIGIHMILFERNCTNLKMAAIGRNMYSYFFAIKYHHKSILP